MPSQITLLGLETIGASLGLALGAASQDILRVGFDLDPARSRQAHKLKAIQRQANSLPDAVRNAELVLAAVPLDQLRFTFETIAPHLKPNAVVMELSPAKSAAAAWAKELLPARTPCIGLLPAINPACLPDPAPRADRFQGAALFIAAPQDTPESALALAADLARLLGAEAIFADALEADGLAALAHTLPQLVSAALINTAVREPGWTEARKLAGRAYWDAASSWEGETPEAAAANAQHHAQSLARLLANLITEFSNIKEDLESGALPMAETLRRAQEAHAVWQRQRQQNHWAAAPHPPLPSSADTFKNLFGLSKKR